MHGIRYSVTRFHDFSAGHRVVGHEGKCRNLHGHNYRVHFVCIAGRWPGIGLIQRAEESLDGVGRVIDFSVIKDRLCGWLEENWDHRFLVWDQDPKLAEIAAVDETVVAVPFNPTAENIGAHLLTVVGPAVLEGTGVALARVIVEETRKCSATSEF